MQPQPTDRMPADPSVETQSPSKNGSGSPPVDTSTRLDDGAYERRLLIGRAVAKLLTQFDPDSRSWNTISARIGVNGSTLSRLRRGKLPLTADIVKKISKWFDRKPHDVYMDIFREACDIRKQFGDVMRVGDPQEIDGLILSGAKENDVFWSIGLERPADWKNKTLLPHVEEAVKEGVRIRYVLPYEAATFAQRRLSLLESDESKLPPPIGLGDVIAERGSVDPVMEYRMWKYGVMGMLKHSSSVSATDYIDLKEQFNDGLKLWVTEETDGLLFYAPHMRYLVIKRSADNSFEAWKEITFPVEGDEFDRSAMQSRIAIKLDNTEAKLLDRWCRYVPITWKTAAKRSQERSETSDSDVEAVGL